MHSTATVQACGIIFSLLSFYDYCTSEEKVYEKCSSGPEAAKLWRKPFFGLKSNLVFVL